MAPKVPVSAREEKEDVFQAVLLADNFSSSIFGSIWADSRYPNRNSFGDDDDDEDDDNEKPQDEDVVDGHHEEAPVEIDSNLAQECLIPLGNRKLLDYSLEALTVSGIQEIFIYCSSGIKGGNAIKDHIKNSKWNELNVKINVISSEDCDSLGDALRDLDAKGMIRNDFILMSVGVITNVALKPLLEDHRKTMKLDKGAVMTLVHRKMPTCHRSRSSRDNQAIIIDHGTGKILAYSHKILGKGMKIPTENLKREMEVVLNTVDTGIAVCSSSVLPLFTDNFDFANAQDFIKNILMNEEVMGNTIYLQQLKNGYATRIVDFESFMGVSLDVLERWSYPLVPDMPFGSNPGDRVYQMGLNFVYKVANVRTARDAMIGPVVVLGSGTSVGNRAVIRNSSIGRNCIIGQNSVITNSQIGDGVTIEDGRVVERCVILDGSCIKSDPQPDSLIVGKQLFQIVSPDEDDDSDTDDDDEPGDEIPIDRENDLTNGGHQEADFKRFSEEVMESLQRGYTDNVALDNLFVEIQGSRTANFMYFDDATVAVIKGILGLAPKLYSDFSESTLPVQWNKTKTIVVKYKELLKLYVKNLAGQENLLKTIEEYANDCLYFRPMIMQLLHYYYDEEILTQDVIFKWYKKESLYEGGSDIRNRVQKLIEWLETASEEESESEDE